MYACQECGKKFRTTAAANRAANNGCPQCGGVDIDLDVDSDKLPAGMLPVKTPEVRIIDSNTLPPRDEPYVIQHMKRVHDILERSRSAMRNPENPLTQFSLVKVSTGEVYRRVLYREMAEAMERTEFLIAGSALRIVEEPLNCQCEPGADPLLAQPVGIS